MPGEIILSQLGGSAQPGTSWPGLSGHVRFTGGTLDGEWITINGNNYEFDVPPDGVGGGNFLVDVSGGAGAAASAAAFAAAVNAEFGVSANVEALVVGGSSDMVLLVSNGSFGLNVDNCPNAVAHNTAGGFVGSMGQALRGPDNSNGSSIIYEGRLITVEDVTALAPGPGFDGAICAAVTQSNNEPTTMSLMFNDAGVLLQLGDWTTMTATWTQVNGNLWALIIDDGAGAELGAGDQILVTWIEN